MDRHTKAGTYLAGRKESVACLGHVHVVMVISKLEESRLFEVSTQPDRGPGGVLNPGRDLERRPGLGDARGVYSPRRGTRWYPGSGLPQEK